MGIVHHKSGKYNFPFFPFILYITKVYFHILQVGKKTNTNNYSFKSYIFEHGSKNIGVEKKIIEESRLSNFSAYFGIFILDLELEETAKNIYLHFEEFCLKFSKYLYVRTLKINVSE